MLDLSASLGMRSAPVAADPLVAAAVAVRAGRLGGGGGAGGRGAPGHRRRHRHQRGLPHGRPARARGGRPGRRRGGPRAHRRRPRGAARLRRLLRDPHGAGGAGAGGGRRRPGRPRPRAGRGGGRDRRAATARLVPRPRGAAVGEHAHRDPAGRRAAGGGPGAHRAPRPGHPVAPARAAPRGGAPGARAAGRPPRGAGGRAPRRRVRPRGAARVRRAAAGPGAPGRGWPTRWATTPTWTPRPSGCCWTTPIRASRAPPSACASCWSAARASRSGSRPSAACACTAPATGCPTPRSGARRPGRSWAPSSAPSPAASTATGCWSTCGPSCRPSGRRARSTPRSTSCAARWSRWRRRARAARWCTARARSTGWPWASGTPGTPATSCGWPGRGRARPTTWRWSACSARRRSGAGTSCPTSPTSPGARTRAASWSGRGWSCWSAWRARLAEMGRPGAAIERYRHLVELDGEREGWHRALMRAYAQAGERPLALRQFHACRATLRSRLGHRAQRRDARALLLAALRRGFRKKVEIGGRRCGLRARWAPNVALQLASLQLECFRLHAKQQCACAVRPRSRVVRSGRL